MDLRRDVAEDKVVIIYFHPVNAKNMILGVVAMKVVSKAPVADNLGDIMSANTLDAGQENALLEAGGIFLRYSGLAVPALDENKKRFLGSSCSEMS